MKLTFTAAALLASVSFAFADSYDGPFCYEPVSMTNATSEDPQIRDEGNVRGTCKKIELRKFYQLDPSLAGDYFFFSMETTEEPSMTLDSATSTSIEDKSYGGKYVSRSYYLGIKQAESTYCSQVFKEHMDVGNILSRSDAKNKSVYDAVHECLDRAAYRLGDIFNFDKIESINAQPYRDGWEDLVAVTSPISGYNEHWVIRKAPSGKLYRENIRSEEVLDNGTTRLLTREDDAPAANDGFFSKLAAFFRTLF